MTERVSFTNGRASCIVQILLRRPLLALLTLGKACLYHSHVRRP